MTFFSADTTGGERVAPRATRFFSLVLPTWATGQNVNRGFSVQATPRPRRMRGLRRRGRNGRGGGDR
jgi:hypothetical protein